MSINESDIQKLVDTEDLEGLCSLVESHVGSEADKERLYEAISSVLSVWTYDCYCKKLGDPADLPYLQGIEALETLSKKALHADRGEYFSLCFDFHQDEGNLTKAKEFALQGEAELKRAIELDDKDQIAYTHLIHLYRHLPDVDNRLGDILKLLDRALALSDTLYNYKLDTLYSHAYSEEVRDVFAAECAQKAKGDSLFALSLAQTYFRILEGAEDPLRPRLEKELLHILEDAKHCLGSGREFDYVAAGHFFSKTGEAFKREDFFLLAEDLFAKGISLTTKFPLMNTYMAKAKEGRAKLLDEANHHDAAEGLRREIRQFYLDNWGRYKNNISYLSHAAENLLGYVMSQPKAEIQQHILDAILSISLASELDGRGHYWFPYSHLFWVNILMDRNEEAKLWLARGYFGLNILVADQVKSLALEAEKRCSPDVVSFIQKITSHLRSIPQNEVWRGGPDYKEISKLTLEAFEKHILL